MTNQTVVNLTPHAITVRGPNGVTTYAPSGVLARADKGAPVAAGTSHLGIPLQRPQQGAGRPYVIGTKDSAWDFPPAVDGTTLLVSGMVLDAVQAHLKGRADVMAPATGPADCAVRDDKGHIVAVTRLNVAAIAPGVDPFDTPTNGCS